jgi:hypothetical protein
VGWSDIAAARAGHQAVAAWIAGLADFLASRASLHVVCARPQTRQLLQLAGLDRALRLARTRAEALKDMPAAAARPGPDRR